MLKLLMMPMLCGCVLLMDAPVDAEQAKAGAPDCAHAETQTDMTLCAGQDFQAADKALNVEYQTARKAMKAQDADTEDAMKGADAALVAAQRAWVSYRDAQCASFGFQAHGGSMEPMLVAQCKADLTRRRTAELKALGEGMGR